MDRSWDYIIRSQIHECREIGNQRWAKWRLSTFDLDPGEGRHGVQGQICDILRPQLAMNRFLNPAPSGYTDSHTLDTYMGGGRGALKLDRCRAFDLFASVDAHLCWERGRAVSFLGIFVSNFRYSACASSLPLLLTFPNLDSLVDSFACRI